MTRGNVADRLHVGHRPQAMHDAQVVGRLQGRSPGEVLLEDSLGLVLRVGVDAEDLAEIGLAGLGQLQPVGLGGRVGFFVRIDVPFAESRAGAPGP